MDIVINYGILFFTLIITLGAQGYIKLKYNKTSKINTNKSLQGREVAKKILEKNGLNNVNIEHLSGELTDHYDPSDKMVRLSDGVYTKTTIAAASVAAHECGHAIQDKDGFFFLKLRRKMVPIVNISSKAGYYAIIIGALFSAFSLIYLGIFLEFIIFFFQLITLPVEFDASKRGLNQLRELNILDEKELKEAKGMLTAAALTYVAAVATSLLQILRLVLIFARRED